jgi:hypothetical protein
MPIKDDESRRAYFREYMRKRRSAPRPAAAAERSPSPPPDGERGCSFQMALDRGCFRNAMMLQLADQLVDELDKLHNDYNELVDDFNELLDEHNELVNDYNMLLGETPTRESDGRR